MYIATVTGQTSHIQKYFERVLATTVGLKSAFLIAIR